MSSSNFDSWREHAANFEYNQVGYFGDRQVKETTNAQLTRGLVQGVSSIEQQRFNKVLISTLGRSPQVISKLASSAGQGYGIFTPPPQPGTEVILYKTGNQSYLLGSESSAANPDQIYSYKLAKSLPHKILPPSFLPTVQYPNSQTSVGGMCGLQINPATAILDPLSTVPSYVHLVDWQKGLEFKYTPVGLRKIIQGEAGLGVAPLATITDSAASQMNIARAVKCTQDFLQADSLIQLYDPLTNSPIQDPEVLSPYGPTTSTPAVFATRGTELTAEQAQALAKKQRAVEFKTQALIEIQKQASDLLRTEFARNLTYPALYGLAKQAWVEDALVKIFDFETILFKNSTYQQIAKVVKTVNKALPYAQRLLAITSGLTTHFQYSGTTVNVDKLTIKPEYFSTINTLNQYLPSNLKLEITETTLKLGSAFIVNLGIPFPFTEEFKSYVNLVQHYLPTDLRWKWGIDNPARALLIAKGVAVSSNLGLLLQDTAVDLAKMIDYSLGCSFPAQTSTIVDSTQIVQARPISTITPIENTDSDALKLFKSTMLSQIAGSVNWVNNQPVLYPDKIVAMAQQAVNTILPPGLQLGVAVSGLGKIKEGITLGPLSFKPKEDGSWSISVPSVHDLKSGVEIINSVGIIPADLQYLLNASVELKSIYDEAKADFRDPAETQAEEAALKVKTAADAAIKQLSIDYNTGAPIIGPNVVLPAPTPDWEGINDTLRSIMGGGGLEPIAEGVFTGKPSQRGTFLALVSVSEKLINNHSQDSSSAQALLGRSDAGVSLRTGEIPTSSGTNYPFFASLCYDRGILIANTEEPNPFNPVSIAPDPSIEIDPFKLGFISGLEYTNEIPATSPAIVVDDQIDPQSPRDALEQDLIELGLGRTASTVLDALDRFLYPPTFEYIQVEIDTDVETDNPEIEIVLDPIVSTLDIVQQELQPVSPTLMPSVKDFIEVVQAAGDLATQQILGGLLVAQELTRPAVEVEKVVQRRLSYKLDCESTSGYAQNLAIVNSLSPEINFPVYASQYALTVNPSATYTTNPAAILNLLDKTEPKLAPAIERLLGGDLFGFWRQLLWAKTGTDLFHSPTEWVRLNTLTRSYYGGAVPSSHPTREWLKQISSI